MFTSRLPTSTSVRRPKSMAENTNTFASSVKRPSNIPVSVKKANLFTPQTAKRPFNFGNSTGGKSNFTPFGATTDRKSYISRPTAKPMPDRDQQIKMFDMLNEFLGSAGYTHPLPDIKKFFSSVSTTESTRLFEFLIAQIIPDFKISRLEIDVPEALKHLNYPQIRAVTKSALVSVTTRQAVVGLLSIFHWLVLYFNTINSDTDLQPIEETVEVMLPFENHLVISYTPPDRFQDKHAELLQKYFPESEINQLEDEHDKLEIENQQVDMEMNEIESLLDVERVLCEDIDNCQKYNDDMMQYVENKKSELSDVSHELNKELNEIESLKLHVDTSSITEESAKEIQHNHNSLIHELEQETLSQQEQLTRVDTEHVANMQAIRNRYEEEMTALRAATNENHQLIKEIRDKHSNLKAREDERIKSKSAYLEKIRNDSLKSHGERLKQGELIKQNFISETELIMDLIRKKGALIEDLDQKSREKHKTVKDIYKRLKRVAPA